MNAHTSITAPLDAATLAMVEEIARARGISGSEFAADAIRHAAEEAINLREFVQVGRDCIARGDVYTQDEVEALFAARTAARRQR
jgi:predicted transcriptional regulator